MTNTRQQLHKMYVGLVYVYWSDENVKLGTAKHKSLQQMQSFSKTVDKQNPISREISNDVNKMRQAVSRQIMTDKSSDLVLDKKQAAQYKEFGERQVQSSKQELSKAIEQAQKSGKTFTDRNKIDAMEQASKQQSVAMKQKAAQYRASKTNAPEKAPRPVAPHKLDQETLMRILQYQKTRNAA